MSYTKALVSSLAVRLLMNPYGVSAVALIAFLVWLAESGPDLVMWLLGGLFSIICLLSTTLAGLCYKQLLEVKRELAEWRSEQPEVLAELRRDWIEDAEKMEARIARDIALHISLVKEKISTSEVNRTTDLLQQTKRDNRTVQAIIGLMWGAEHNDYSKLDPTALFKE